MYIFDIPGFPDFFSSLKFTVASATRRRPPSFKAAVHLAIFHRPHAKAAMIGTRALALFLVSVCAASAEVQAAFTCPACESTLPASRLARAFGMAEEIHRGVTRKGTGVPYLTHVMSVSSMAMEEGGSEDEGIAGAIFASIAATVRSVYPPRRIAARHGNVWCTLIGTPIYTVHSSWKMATIPRQ